MDPNKTIGENADNIFRNFESAGSSVKHEPSKPEIREWGHQIGEEIGMVAATLATVGATGSGNRSVSRFWGSPIEVSQEDQYSRDDRLIPPGLQVPPIRPTQVRGPGDVVMNRTVTDAFAGFYPTAFAGDVAYVSPTGGAPGSAALNDRTKPFSLAYALRTLTASALLIALPGVYNSMIDFRGTDAAGAMKKALFAETPGTAIFRISGDDVSTLTFTQDGTYSDIWNATWSGSGAPHRVIRSDIFDNFGFPARLRKAADKAALNALTYGVTWNTGTKQLSVKWAGADVNTIRGLLRAYWTDASGNSRHLMVGAEMLVNGFVHDGIGNDLIRNGATRSSLWLDNNQTIFNPVGAVGDAGGDAGRAIIGRWRLHGSEGDGVNLNYSSSVAARSLMVVANSHVTECGDYDAFGVNGTSNKQAFSSHGGDHLNAGNLIEANYGQQLADTSTDPAANVSWLVGVLARQGGRSVSPANATGFGMYGAGGGSARVAYIDTCEWQGDGSGTVGLDLDEGASAYVFNSQTLLPATVVAPSVQPTAYFPDAP